MTGDDDRADWLRERLDRELSAVSSQPEALREILAGTSAGPRPARRGPGRPPAWFVAAAAVLVVALAVPILSGTVFARPAVHDRLGLASSSPPPASPTAVASATASPTAGPTASPYAILPVSPSSIPAPVRTSLRTTSPATPAGDVCGSKAVAGAGIAVDLDGDGRPDTVGVSGSFLVVRLTGSGTASYPLPTSPFVAALPVQTGSAAGSQLLVLTRGAIGSDASVGMLGTLFAARRCMLAPVLNAQGKPYAFEVGSSQGDTVRAGVSCDGSTLYGVTSVLGAAGWTVTRTPVSSTSGRAVNGTPLPSSIAAGDPAAAALSQAGCGSVLPVPLG